MSIEELAPVSVHFHEGRGDYFTTATRRGRASAAEAGYAPVGVEGWANAAEGRGAIRNDTFLSAFDLYWHPKREDNFTTATPQGKADAKAAGYQFVRTEAWLSSNTHDDNTAVQLMWSPQRQDNLATASPEVKARAMGDGYAPVRVEGWMREALNPVYWEASPKVFWHEDRGDHLTSVAPGLTRAAAEEGYHLLLPGYGNYRGNTPRMAPEDQVPLELFWHEGRQDHFTTATEQGKADAKAAGYRSLGTQGWVWPAPEAVPRPTPDHVAIALALYWNADLQDNALVPEGWEHELNFHERNYSFVRNEGYVQVWAGIS